MKVKRQAPPHPAFVAGQKWRMDGVTCHIGPVGKTLVTYKLLKDTAIRGACSLKNKPDLTRFLEVKKAVLVPA